MAAIQVETESNTIGQAAKKQVVVSASVAPQTVAPGEKVELVLSVTIPAGYHIYGSRNSNNPTTVELADSTNFSAGAAEIPQGRRHRKDGAQTEFWLTGTKEIRQQITVAESATGTVEISGEVAFMMCDKNFCKPPAKVAFQTQLTVAATDVDKKATEPKKKLRQTIAKPTETMDYSKLAFFPQRWVERGVSTEMYAWKGEEVCLLTQTNDLDQELMTTFVGNLDRGYKFYRDMVGASPRPSRIWLDKPVIASVPTHRLTCGFACGYVGATGIEVSNFANDYKAVKANANSMPHYYYYEMGRNYYVFGSRHNAFVTGYAVFMRYCCLDSLGITDNDKKTRKAIEEAISTYEKSDLGFVKSFTSAGGLSEKQQRFKNYKGPCDQPVMYASLMLKLRQDYGGEGFLKRFYHTVRLLPEFGNGARNAEDAKKQCLSWMIAASFAAKRNLAPLFVDQWRLPASKEIQAMMKEIDWGSGDFEVAKSVIDAVKH